MEFCKGHWETVKNRIRRQPQGGGVDPLADIAGASGSAEITHPHDNQPPFPCNDGLGTRFDATQQDPLDPVEAAEMDDNVGSLRGRYNRPLMKAQGVQRRQELREFEGILQKDAKIQEREAKIQELEKKVEEGRLSNLEMYEKNFETLSQWRALIRKARKEHRNSIRAIIRKNGSDESLNLSDWDSASEDEVKATNEFLESRGRGKIATTLRDSPSPISDSSTPKEPLATTSSVSLGVSSPSAEAGSENTELEREIQKKTTEMEAQQRGTRKRFRKLKRYFGKLDVPKGIVPDDLSEWDSASDGEQQATERFRKSYLLERGSASRTPSPSSRQDLKALTASPPAGAPMSASRNREDSKAIRR